MNGLDALTMLSWTRERLFSVIEVLPEEFLDFKPQGIPKSERYNKPRIILSHIAFTESYWLHEKVVKDPYQPSTWSFPGKTKDVIIEALNLIRAKTNYWLEHNLDLCLDQPYSTRAKKTYSWLFYHVAEHEAHHLGQICLLTTLAGVKIPWV